VGGAIYKGERMSDVSQTLTEKEKETLRLMGRGHDAKSLARHLGLSVHTINERLRAARRKLSASSSREAARRLLDSEGETPDFRGDTLLGEAGGRLAPAQEEVAISTRRRMHRPLWIATGVDMSLILAIAALALQPQATPASADAPSQASAAQAEIARSARTWLAIVDAGRWEESWRATGESFRSLNTVAAWASASEQARVPLGAVVSRADLSQESVPAPPHGYEMVKFRTSFANRANVVETVTLVREAQAWRVVGYWLD
jgi:DNA-binding CsgD family transcriptional regulator